MVGDLHLVLVVQSNWFSNLDSTLSWTVVHIGTKSRPGLRQGAGHPTDLEGCYLVDPASSRMLVSKIKPCM